MFQSSKNISLSHRYISQKFPSLPGHIKPTSITVGCMIEAATSRENLDGSTRVSLGHPENQRI